MKRYFNPDLKDEKNLVGEMKWTSEVKDLGRKDLRSSRSKDHRLKQKIGKGLVTGDKAEANRQRTNDAAICRSHLKCSS